MLAPPLPSALMSILAVALLGACSDAQVPTGGAPADEPASPFSEQDRAAARVLSIGNRGAVVEADNPRDQAAVCSNAIGELAERFRQRGGLTGEQLATLDRARDVYDRRLQLLGSQQGDRQNDVGAEEQQEAEESESGESALLAVGCIQKLAEAG